MGDWTLSDTVRHLRKQRLPEWSQEELAEKAGVAGKTIYRLERGGRADTKTIMAVAQAFGMTAADLLAYRPTALEPQVERGLRDLVYTAFARLSPADQLDFLGRIIDAGKAQQAREKGVPPGASE